MNIAIIGSGICGLATANALLKKGFNVQVYERAQVLRPIGAGLMLTPNGLNSLNALSRRHLDAKERVLELFSGWAEPVEAIIAATPEADIIERPIRDRLPIDHWSNGRVTLMGDAAHPVIPSLGQGANMAFEDAYELAECLSNAPDIETALQAYETSRIPRTEVIYDRSANAGRNSYQSDETTFTKMMNPSQMNQDNFEAWLYSYNPSRPLVTS